MKIFYAIGALFVLPLIGYAQIFDFDVVNPRIQVSPEGPRPRETITLTLSPLDATLSTSIITWYRNGAAFAKGEGMVVATTTAPDLGAALDVRARIEGETTFTSNATIRSGSVTLLWSADTYTPPFYQGRALPTENSTIRAEAIPELVLNGTQIAPKDLVFTWSINGVNQPKLSGRGKTRAVIRAPLGGIRTIGVTTTTKDNVYSASATVTIPINQNIVHLYREHPLFGTLFHRVLPEAISLNETDVELTAVPFFSDTSSPNTLEYSWTINGAPAAINSERPQHVRLTSEGLGSAALSLTLTNALQVLEETRREWSVLLGERIVTDTTL
jgi:hypothetical protein